MLRVLLTLWYNIAYPFQLEIGFYCSHLIRNFQIVAIILFLCMCVTPFQIMILKYSISLIPNNVISKMQLSYEIFLKEKNFLDECIY